VTPVLLSAQPELLSQRNIPSSHSTDPTHAQRNAKVELKTCIVSGPGRRPSPNGVEEGRVIMFPKPSITLTHPKTPSMYCFLFKSPPDIIIKERITMREKAGARPD
jgi:hypothetical protein